MTSTPTFPLIWITGASAGIGRALALRCARSGSVVVASARTDAALDTLVAEAAGLDGRIVAKPVDVTDDDALAAAYREIVAAEGVPDLCIMNAGTHIPVDGTSLKAADFKTLLDLNVMGVVRVLEAVVPDMVARGSGRLAIVGSVSGYRGLRTASAYGASKAALINMSEALRVELGEHSVVVQMVNPGFVETPLTDENDFPMPFLMPVDKAADAFYRGLQTDRFEITFPKRFTWLVKAMRLLPYAVYLPMMAAMTRRRR